MDEMVALEKYAGRLILLRRDLSDPRVASSVLHEVEEMQPCDSLVNVAGIAHPGLTAALSIPAVIEMANVNLIAPIMLSRVAGMYMMRRRSGCIINVSSIAATSALDGLTVYGSTKAGLEQFSRGLARELGPRGVRVNCVAPGFLSTAMSASLGEKDRSRIRRRTPLNAEIRVDDVCENIEYLLSDAAKTITGQVIKIDGGFSL